MKYSNDEQNGAWIEYDGYDLNIVPERSEVEQRLWGEGSYERMVTDVIRTRLESGDIAIDVGAHVGHHSLTMLSEVGPDGTVWAFEPSPSRATQLRNTIEKNSLENLVLLEKALSSSTGTTTLVHLPGGSPFVGEPMTDEMEATEVETVSLREFLSTEAIESVGLIKIDVEAHEAAALSGMREVIDSVETMVLEIHKGYTKRFHGQSGLDTIDTVTGEFSEIRDIDADERIEKATDAIRDSPLARIVCTNT